MHATLNDLPLDIRKNVCTLLSASLADAVDLTLCAKSAHWNLRGPNFIALHKMFDELYADTAEYADLIAERIKALGGMADGSRGRVAADSRLPAYPVKATDSSEHVAAVSAALASFGKYVRESIDACTALGDASSADVFTEISRGTDKWLWFVESNLPEAASKTMKAS